MCTEAYQGWFHTQTKKEDHQLPPVSEDVATIPVQRNINALEFLQGNNFSQKQNILSELLSNDKKKKKHTYIDLLTNIYNHTYVRRKCLNTASNN